MSKLIRANFVRMLRSLEFMACALFSFAAGLFNVLSCCVLNSPKYQTTFEKDLFNLSGAVVFISAVFVGIFFGTENSVLRNKLIVGYKRGEVYFSNLAAAMCGVFIINALSMLPYAVIAPMRGAKLGDLTPSELMFNALIEALAVLAAGGIYFLVTVIFSRKSICAAGTLLSAIILTYLPQTDAAMRYSPCGQLEILKNREYTAPSMAVCSAAVIIASVIVGAAVFGRKNLR